MADNLTTTTTVATIPATTAVATVEASHSGDTVHAGVGVIAVSSGAEGSRWLTLIDPRGGDVAHDAADSGNPIKVGAKAVAHGANPTAVAAADRTDLSANRAGVLFTIGGHPNVITSEVLSSAAAQTDAALITVSAGTKIVLTSIEVSLDEATTVGVGFRIGFAAATTPTTTGVVLSHAGMVPGGWLVRGDGSGILGIGADGEDLRITSDAATNGALRVVVSYFTIES
jgi:hypothetical protein